MNNNIALITGASAGIGEACAEVFAKEGYNLILCARRIDRLNNLAAALEEKYGTEILNLELDIRNYPDIEEKLSSIPRDWKRVDVLINNAGLARGWIKLHEADVQDFDEMVDTNVKGLLYISRVVIPWLVERKTGHVINIGSIAGREVYPGGSVYCATKSAVDAISKGMTIDLIGSGVRITNIEPGMVETEFSLVRFRGDEECAKKVYQSFKPLSSKDIAGIALFCAGLPQHVQIQQLLVTPTDQASVYIVNKK